MQCSNNLKQLALANHTFHDAHNCFTANGAVWDIMCRNNAARNDYSWDSGCQWISGWCFLLPFVEQTASHELWMEEFHNSQNFIYATDYTDGIRYSSGLSGPNIWNQLPATDWARTVPAGSSPADRYFFGRVDENDTSANPRAADAHFLACPSDSNGNQLVTQTIASGAQTGGQQVGEVRRHRTGNYMFSSGDFCNSVELQYNTLAAGRFKGCWTRGFFNGQHLNSTMSEIADGVSNVIMLSERIAGKDGGDSDGNAAALATAGNAGVVTLSPGANHKGYIYQAAAVVGSSNVDNMCWAKIKGVDTSVVYLTPGQANYDNPQAFRPDLAFTLPAIGGQALSVGGTRWYNAVTNFTWFNTVLPPNAPSVTGMSGQMRHAALLPPTSNHTGGVNAAFGDGSVHFITETIDWQTNPDGAGIVSAAVNGGYPAMVYEGASPFGVWGALGAKDDGKAASIP